MAATGFRPDHSITCELRLDLDPILGCTRSLAELIDPNEDSRSAITPHGYAELSHAEPNYYVAGMKSYGRAPTFLMTVGYNRSARSPPPSSETSTTPRRSNSSSPRPACVVPGSVPSRLLVT
ncbi:hypothetical protein SAMN05421748_102333 [Paractinoplanes atraurantiacus]|uniref:Uncharacterized protein n=1 Tax=Paractinoplanes atraurantiacus TaxID=1036182 RepID=A0A285GPB4_9ACTN|nr:hypothetical protein SAMN05421748_102333 [Actinoplanes atraurantiacus]